MDAPPPLDVERIGTEDEWPVAVSDGLELPCSDCGEVSKFDYRVTDAFWQRWVPEDESRLGVICLPCLDHRCGGRGIVEALQQVDWLGIGHTVRMMPVRRIDYTAREDTDASR